MADTDTPSTPPNPATNATAPSSEPATSAPTNDETPPQPAHPALATSKRKFHKLLENLTKPSAQKRAHDTLSTAADSPAKRIRLEARARLEAKGPAGSTVAARVQSQLLRSRLEAARATRSQKNTDGDNATGKEPPREPPREPNYVPWSHEAFLRRLKTFADLRLWTSKPSAVNEVAWARRGWVCVGVNTVCCKGGCEQRVVVVLRPAMKDEEGEEIEGSEDFGHEVDEDLVKRVEELIVLGHEDGCLWRDAGCRDDIYRLPIARPSVWQPQLRERYQSFEAISALLPAASRLETLADAVSIAKLLPPELLSLHPGPTQATGSSVPNPVSEATTSDDDPINYIALSFALLGWTGHLEAPGSALATCKACFRRLGLWLYATENLDASQESIRDPNDDGDENDRPIRLDLINNHREHCPWVNGSSQAMPGSMAGLAAHEVLKKCIENDAGFRGVEARPSSSSGHRGEPDPLAGSEGTGALAAGSTPLSKDDIEKEDKARFARLKELSKAIGLKGAGLRAKLGRMTTGANVSRPSSAGVT